MKSFNFKKNCPKHSNFMESCPRLGYFTLKMLSYSTKSYSIKGKQTERITKKISRFSKYINPYLPIYLMDKSFITINNPETTFIQKECDDCFDFGSVDSDICFRLFIFGKFGYFQELQKCLIPHINKMKTNYIPYKIWYFVHQNDFKYNMKANVPEALYDSDFELMFSRTEEHLIGSYAKSELSI